ncbi:MAG TPA: hypothetical protein VFV52_08880 [Bacilli bacterium]|nr:hypothetical protein [Bacilli bacterium]
MEKLIDRLADQSNGQYVVPKAPMDREADASTSAYIKMLKKKSETHRVK